jgi:hypothetical protein
LKKKNYVFLYIWFYFTSLVTNVFDKFWGPCEVAEQIIKRFLDQGTNNQKTDFINVEKSHTGDTFGKIKFASKPIYFVSHVIN